MKKNNYFIQNIYDEYLKKICKRIDEIDNVDCNCNLYFQSLTISFEPENEELIEQNLVKCDADFEKMSHQAIFGLKNHVQKQRNKQKFYQYFFIFLNLFTLLISIKSSNKLVNFVLIILSISFFSFYIISLLYKTEFKKIKFYFNLFSELMLNILGNGMYIILFILLFLRYYCNININDEFLKFYSYLSSFFGIALIKIFFYQIINRNKLDKVNEEIEKSDNPSVRANVNILYEKLIDKTTYIPKSAKPLLKIRGHFFIMVIFLLLLTLLLTNEIIYQDFFLWFGFSLLLFHPAINKYFVVGKLIDSFYYEFKQGFLIPNEKIINHSYKAIICFNKTGTLTEGTYNVYKVFSKGISKIELVKIMASIESQVKNSRFKRLSLYLKQQNAIMYDVTNFINKPGVGIEAMVNHVVYYVGQESYMIKLGLDIKNFKYDYDNYASLGYRVNLLANDDEVLGLVVLNDQLRTDSIETISFLNKRYTTSMMTSDSALSTNVLEDKLCVSKSYFEAKPNDKKNIIRGLKQSGKTVFFVNDLNNDWATLTPNDGLIYIANKIDFKNDSDLYIFNGDIKNVALGINHARKINLGFHLMLYLNILFVSFIWILYFVSFTKKILNIKIFWFFAICLMLSYTIELFLKIFLNIKRCIKKGKYKIYLTRIISTMHIENIAFKLKINGFLKYKVNIKHEYLLVKLDNHQQLEVLIDMLIIDGYKINKIK